MTLRLPGIYLVYNTGIIGIIKSDLLLQQSVPIQLLAFYERCVGVSMEHVARHIVPHSLSIWRAAKPLGGRWKPQSFRGERTGGRVAYDMSTQSKLHNFCSNSPMPLVDHSVFLQQLYIDSCICSQRDRTSASHLEVDALGYSSSTTVDHTKYVERAHRIKTPRLPTKRRQQGESQLGDR